MPEKGNCSWGKIGIGEVKIEENKWLVESFEKKVRWEEKKNVEQKLDYTSEIDF